FYYGSVNIGPLWEVVEIFPVAFAFLPDLLFGVWGLLAAFAIMAGGAAIPLAKITEERLRLPWTGVAVAAIYLLSLPIWGQRTGAITFGTELAFPLFFFAGYALLLKGRHRLALTVFAGSAFVHWGYGDAVALLGLLILVGLFPEFPSRLRSGTALMAAGVAPVVFGWLLVPWGANLGDSLGSATTSVMPLPPLELLTLVFLLVLPFALAPLLSPRWLLLTLPFFALMALYGGHYALSLFHSVHVTAYLPFILLAFIDGLRRVPGPQRWPILALSLGITLALAAFAWGLAAPLSWF
ncbi:MAG: hypothetical protein KGI26_04885, partial [Thaumarchaeota archaeon]|nr:hypothetical protein [Nitrososphaerota archaeon]